MTAQPETKRARDEGRMKHQAIDGRRGNMFFVDPESVDIVLDPAHYLYDARAEEPLTEEGIRTADKFGVREVVFVAKEGEKTLLVAGRKRTLSLRAANERRKKRGEESRELPVIVVKGTPVELKEIMILENEARQEDTPLNKARKTKAYIQMLNEVGIVNVASQKERAAETFNVTTKTIEARLKLLELQPEIQNAVEEHKIGFWAATELHGLKEEEQKEALGTLLAETTATGKKPSIERAKGAAEKDGAKKRERLAKALSDLKDAAIVYGEVKSGVKKTALAKAAEKFYAATRKS